MRGNQWTMSYEHRRDGRTDAEFARDIGERTAKENACVRIWFEQWIKPAFPDCELCDTGCDNAGTVITGAGDFSAADFGLRFPNKEEFFHVEAKASFSYDVMTFKDESLNAYERRYDGRPFRLLCFLGTSRGQRPGRGTSWFAVKLEDFQRIREEGRYQRHDPDFGGKATYRIGSDEICEWFQVNRLYKEGN